MKTIFVDAVYAFVIPGQGIYAPLHALLESFPNRKIILTGATSEQMKEFGLVNMPYEVFTLRGNPPKSDPAYYETVLAHFALAADEVVYFEHNEQAVASAKSVGIPTFHYDSEKKDVEKLKRFFARHL